MFRNRNSYGSTPSSLAIISIWDSTAKATCGLPGARMCPQGTLLVYTMELSMCTWGMQYGPPLWSAPRMYTRGLNAPYAPLLKTTRAWCASMRPSLVTPVFRVMSAG